MLVQIVKTAGVQLLVKKEINSGARCKGASTKKISSKAQLGNGAATNLHCFCWVERRMARFRASQIYVQVLLQVKDSAEGS